MVWVLIKAFWFFMPALDDVLIGRESVQGFEPLGEIISIQEVKAMLSELLVIFVVIAFNGGLFQGSIISKPCWKIPTGFFVWDGENALT
jgi:hypothetical protein